MMELELVMSWLNTIAIVIIFVLIFRQSKKMKSILNNRSLPRSVYHDSISNVYKKINSLSEEIRNMRLDKTSEISGGFMSEKLYRNSSVIAPPEDFDVADRYSNYASESTLKKTKHTKCKQPEIISVDVFSTTGELIATKRIELQSVSCDI